MPNWAGPIAETKCGCMWVMSSSGGVVGDGDSRLLTYTCIADIGRVL